MIIHIHINTPLYMDAEWLVTVNRWEDALPYIADAKNTVLIRPSVLGRKVAWVYV